MRIKAKATLGGRLVRGLSAGLILLGVAGGAQGAPICTSDPTGAVDEICSNTRDLGIWFGTLSVVGAAAPAQDFVQPTDRIAVTLEANIQFDQTVDPRVKAGISPYVDPIAAVEWVLGAPQNLPAQQNLLDAYSAAVAALDAAFGPGTLAVGGVSMVNERDYILASTTGAELIDGGIFRIVTTNYVAHASFFEQNATYTVRPGTVPEPGTLALLAGCLVAGWAVRRPRKSAPGPHVSA